MAWRIAKLVASGQIDNRSNGHITGTLELAGDLGTISLDLEGNGHPDLAGCLIRFRNPRAAPPADESPLTMGLAMEQTGHAGDMTASRRVKDLLVPLAEFREMDEAARASAFRWANGLYLEWFSEANGRVVVEGTGFEVEVIEGPHWTMSVAALREQAGRAARGMEQFLADSAQAVRTAAALGDIDEELPQAEAEMDALSAMDSADEEALASPAWREGTRKRITGILLETHRLIEEARDVLRKDEDFGC